MASINPNISKQGYVYFADVAGGRIIKIGHTIDPASRAKSLSRHASSRFGDGRIKFLAAFPGRVADEKRVHLLFSDYSIGNSEWFFRAPAIDSYISNLQRAPLPVEFPGGAIGAKILTMDALGDALTTREVSEISGLSLRKLQWWDERGFFVADRFKRKRYYRREDLPLLRLTAILCRSRKMSPVSAIGITRLIVAEFPNCLANI